MEDVIWNVTFPAVIMMEVTVNLKDVWPDDRLTIVQEKPEMEDVTRNVTFPDVEMMEVTVNLKVV
jgi:hypothetical protein